MEIQMENQMNMKMEMTMKRVVLLFGPICLICLRLTGTLMLRGSGQSSNKACVIFYTRNPILYLVLRVIHDIGCAIIE